MTFRAWLAKQTKRKDHVGALARGAEKDVCWTGATAVGMRRHVEVDHQHRLGSAMDDALTEWWLVETDRMVVGGGR